MSVRYTIGDCITCREEGPDGALLYDPDTDRVQVMNYTALRIFRLCDGTRTAAEIAEALAEEFDDVPATVADDVADMLRRMETFGFLRPIAEASQ